MSSGADGGSKLQFHIEIELCLAQSSLTSPRNEGDFQLLMHYVDDF